MAFSPSAAKTAEHQASSLTVPVEYIRASADRSSSWKPTTKRSGSSGSARSTRIGLPIWSGTCGEVGVVGVRESEKSISRFSFQRTDMQTPSERASRGLAEGEWRYVFQGRELRLTVVLF